MCGFPFAPIQILTGDTRKACSSRHGWLHDAGRSFQRKSRIERRFESLPGVQRFANLWGTPRSFRTSEKNKFVPFREVRGFPNLESAHPNNDHALTKLKPSQKKNRGSANLDSAHQNYNFAQTQLNPFAAPRLSHKIGSPQPRRAYINGAISFSSPPYSRRMNVFFFRSAA